MPQGHARQGVPSSIAALTTKEKIQLYLFDFNRFADAFEAPPDVTQEGIAQAAGIRIQHVQQYVKPLISEGLVEERTSHVARRPRRLKVYFLTERGRSHVATVRGAFLNQAVPFRIGDREPQPVPLMRILQEERRGATLLELLRELEVAGSISQAPKAKGIETVDFAQEAPRIERFYGRTRELDLVSAALANAPVVVVTGLAGVGKTALASKLAETLRRKRSVFWRQIRSWDTAIDLALRLSFFLQALGRLGLHGNLMGPGAQRLSRVEELLAADVDGLDALLIFDDVHDASDDAQAFLSILLRVLSQRKGTSALLLSRAVPAFYSRREVEIDRSVIELAMKGLDRDAAGSLLREAGVDDPHIGDLIEASGANPLFLKLLATSGPTASVEGRRTLDTYIAEQVEPRLDDAERACLEVGSLYRVPVAADGLLRTPDASQKTIVSLQRKGLLETPDGDRFVLHDSIRGYFEKGMASERREFLAAKVGPWLEEQARAAADRGDPSRAITYLGNALAIEVDPKRRLEALDRLGQLRGRLGDVLGALEAYRTALALAPDAEAKARFHQRIAKCLRAAGNLDEADREVEEGLAILPPRPSLEAAWLIFQKAGLAYGRQDFPQALQLVEQVGSWMAGLPKDPELWGHLVNLKGLIHLDDPKPDLALAKAEFLEAIEAFRTAQYQPGLAGVYNNLALTESYAGLGDQALTDLDRSAELARGAGDLPTLLTALFSKAGCLSEGLGRFDEAESLYEETFKLAKDIRAHEMIVLHYRDTVPLYCFQGRYEQAREAQAYFLESSGDLLNTENRIVALALLARICVLCADPKSAEARVRDAEALLRRAPSDIATQSIAWARATIAASLGEANEAEALFQRAYDLPAGGDRGRFLLDYGRFLASRGKVERGKEILSEATRELAGSKPLRKSAEGALQALERPAP